MTGKEFAEKCKKVAKECKTLYVMGGWGEPLTPANKAYFKNNYAFNTSVKDGVNRGQQIDNATSDTFAFDCVCFVKSMLDGFSGNVNAARGGATYGKPCPDMTIQALYDECYGKSTNLKDIAVGELVVSKDYGHCGIYVGDNMVCECTYSRKDGVQLIPLDDPQRKDMWRYHGKLAKYMDYNTTQPNVKATDHTKALKDIVNGKILCKKGDKGDYVKAIQLVLIDKGFTCGVWGADGDFGNGTYNAVANFQRSNGLTADGIVGYDTLTKILK